MSYKEAFIQTTEHAFISLGSWLNKWYFW